MRKRGEEMGESRNKEKTRGGERKEGDGKDQEEKRGEMRNRIGGEAKS